jgi:predicted MFS family arabinose efflux permease
VLARLAPIAVYSNIFLVMLSLGVIAPNLNDIRRDFDVSYGEISWGITAFALARLVTNLPAGILTNRVPRLPLLMAGTACVLVGSLIAALSGSLWLFLVARSISGVGSAVSSTVGLTIVLDAASPAARGKASGKFHSALGGGGLIGPGFGGILASIWGWRAALFGASCAAALSILLLALAVRALRAPAETTVPVPMATGARIRRRTLIFGAASVAYLAAFATFFNRGGVQQTVVPLMGRDVIGLSPGSLALVLMATGAVGTFLGPFVGGLSDRYGRNAILQPGLLLLALGTALTGFATGVPLFLIGVFLSGIAGTTFSIPTSQLVDIVGPEQRGFAIGMYRVVGDFALTIAPVLTGFVVDHQGFKTGALISSVVILAALAPSIALTRPASRRAHPTASAPP